MKQFLFLFLGSLMITGSAMAQNERQIQDTAQRIERKAENLARVVDRNLYDRRTLQNRATLVLDRLQQDMDQLRRLLRQGGGGGGGRGLQWVFVGDRAPNRCQGTAQAGDGNPHIAYSPDEYGVRCDRRTQGVTFCDAGRAANGAYVDRYWRCERR